MMHYKEATQWLFEQLPMYQHKGASALNAKLDGIKKFCNYLVASKRPPRPTSIMAMSTLADAK